MDVEIICNAYSRGIEDGLNKKEKVKQENFNLDVAYNYGYSIASNIKITNETDDIVA